MTYPSRCPSCVRMNRALSYLTSPLAIEVEDGEMVELDWLSHAEALDDQILRKVADWKRENQPAERTSNHRECSRHEPWGYKRW